MLFSFIKGLTLELTYVSSTSVGLFEYPVRLAARRVWAQSSGIEVSAQTAAKCHNSGRMHTPPVPTDVTTLAWRRWVSALGLGLCVGGGCAAAESDRAEAWRIMTERHLGNCIACHALPGQTGVRSTFGPSLQGVGSRYNAEQLQQWVVDARQLHPNTLMPPFGNANGLNRVNSAEPLLSPDQIRLVVTGLAQWR
jgi:sulfur oxidation c-type cytochrome SoxX